MIIVETPATHRGIKLYIVQAPSLGKRTVYALEGAKDRAVKFPNETAAELAMMNFSSAYGLVMRETE